MIIDIDEHFCIPINDDIKISVFKDSHIHFFIFLFDLSINIKNTCINTIQDVKNILEIKFPLTS